MRALALLALALAACSNGETAPPLPEPLATPLSTALTPGAEVRRGKVETLACFPELPPGAEQALLSIQAAAEAGDLDTLRGWVDGEAGSNPETLRELAAVLDRGCLEDESGERVVCPPEYRRDPAYPGWRARLERRPGGWRLASFAAGD